MGALACRSVAANEPTLEVLMDVAEVTGCRCHEEGTLCPHCAEQIRKLMRGEEHSLMVPPQRADASVAQQENG
jgi:hypothetical protein